MVKDIKNKTITFKPKHVLVHDKQLLQVQMSLKIEKEKKKGESIFFLHNPQETLVRLGLKSITESEPKLKIKYINYMIV